jgi:uncharacterized protein YggU (UPF0235/DUF167 family)
MGSVEVRVLPRAGRQEVLVRGGVIVVRVTAPAAEGRATEEARRALAAAVGVRASLVRLRSGARSRTKVFEVEGVSEDDLRRRLRGPPNAPPGTVR